jgi:hypothetical protein
VALAAAVAVCSAPTANAELGDTVTRTEPSGVLVMPFDVTENRVSFQIVSRTGDNLGGDPIATHWSFWSKDCGHLADVFICLTPNDTVIVDPTNLHNVADDNTDLGGKIDLSVFGDRAKGLLTVTAFEAGSSGCTVLDPTSVIDNQIVGGWTIANTTTNAGFGNDAIGMNLIDGAGFPDLSILTPAGIRIQSANPEDLEDSEVMLITIEQSEESGNGDFIGTEVGPIPRSFELSNGERAHVCCNVAYVDNLEARISLPDVCFDCVGFAPIADSVAGEGETSIIPPALTITSSGFVHLTNCRVLNDLAENDPFVDDIAESNLDQFIFAFHGMAVGPFGTSISGKYTNASLF